MWLFVKCPRQDSNLRTRFRKPLLYPLSYEGAIDARRAARKSFLILGGEHSR